MHDYYHVMHLVLLPKCDLCMDFADLACPFNVTLISILDLSLYKGYIIVNNDTNDHDQMTHLLAW